MVSGLHGYVFWLVWGLPRPPTNYAAGDYGGWATTLVANFFVGAGASAVTLFFVISGYVLKLSIDKSSEGSAFRTSIAFTIKRLFRIYPAVLAVIMAAAFLEPYLFISPTQRSWSEILLNMSLASSTMDWPTWSIRVEILAVPAILLFWFTRKRFGCAGLIGLTAALAGLSFARSLYGEDMFGRYVFVFGLGMLIHDLPRSLSPSRALATLAALATIAAIFARPVLSFHAQSAILVEAICATYLLTVLVHGGLPRSKALLGHRILRFLGRVSYSFYLIHFLVLLTIVRQVPGLISAVAFGNPYVAALLSWLSIVVISIPIAAVIYRWIELPGVNAGRIVASMKQHTK